MTAFSSMESDSQTNLQRQKTASLIFSIGTILISFTIGCFFLFLAIRRRRINLTETTINDNDRFPKTDASVESGVMITDEEKVKEFAVELKPSSQPEKLIKPDMVHLA